MCGLGCSLIVVEAAAGVVSNITVLAYAKQSDAYGTQFGRRLTLHADHQLVVVDMWGNRHK